MCRGEGAMQRVGRVRGRGGRARVRLFVRLPESTSSVEGYSTGEYPSNARLK